MKIKNDLQNSLKKFRLQPVCLMIGIILLSGAAAARVNYGQDGRPGKTPDPYLFEAEKLLAGLGYWITKIDGIKDASTYHAVVAFQKTERRKRTGLVTASEVEAMKNAARPSPKFAGEAHIEIDITRQILFMVDAGGVTIILPVSTGSDERYFSEGKWQIAHTPRGEFKVTRQIFGVRRAPLGNLYYPNYFSGGVAIHGSASIPFEPASHGCVRIPNFAARDFQALVAIGTKVFVYD